MKYLTIIAFAITTCFNSCDTRPFVDKFYRLSGTNNSSSEIRVYLADEYAPKQYPDTTLPNVKPALQKAPVGKSCYFDSKTPWEGNLARLRKDTLSIFFIDNTVYETEPWDSIRVHYKILRRLDLSIKDLKARDYKIVYP